MSQCLREGCRADAIEKHRILGKLSLGRRSDENFTILTETAARELVRRVIEPPQNWSFAAIFICRGGAAFTICPKPALLMLLLTADANRHMKSKSCIIGEPAPA